jgi:D-proline reductase (dithiol) PrdB
MPRLDTLPATVRNKLLLKPVEINHETPWTPLARPLDQARVALVTTAGVHLRDDRPFVGRDPSYRCLPSSTRQADILQSHTSLGFDRLASMQDINVVFPVDRIREMASAGEIGSLAPVFYSFMGAQPDVSAIMERTSWEVADLLKQSAVDIVVITPSCPFCTHTSGVVARNLEAAGLTTVVFSLVREHTEKLKPPRALFVPFPFGMPMGRPERPAEQLAVLRAGFDLLLAERGPVLSDYPDPENLASLPGAPVQASDVVDSSPQADLALEVSATRRYWDQWLAGKGHTRVGLTGIDPKRFRGVVRYLEAYLEGDDPKRPSAAENTISTAAFVRHCVEDLRSMYLEARMYTHPAEPSEDRHNWFWSQTAYGTFLRKLRDHMDSSPDPETKEAATSIAR